MHKTKLHTIDESPAEMNREVSSHIVFLSLADSESAVKYMNDTHLDPGQSTRLHLVEISHEIVYFYQGEGIIEINGIPETVESSDRVTLAQGESFKITNNSVSVLSFVSVGLIDP